MRILLIEPDKLLASTYTQALEFAGHAVDHALSGQGAIARADAVAPELVIMELQLPAQNGIAFLQEFRSYAEWQTIPVMLHTYATPQGMEQILDTLKREYGVVGWLYKPQTSLQQLVSVVHRQAVMEV